ncbi:MAG: DUF2071 domain-containing protein [Calditrichaeota bacterium]|nr:MAG: DUF2071 domain-containing protein [Calditrichota bacterium]
MPVPFLTSQWRHIVMLNYEIEPERLQPFLPRDLEIDRKEGKTLLSLVGLMFYDTRLYGFPVPFHRKFPEVNLRFYVRRRVKGKFRRGVVFIKEIVPKAMVSAVARRLYHENYTTLPLTHLPRNKRRRFSPGDPVAYRWLHRGRWNELYIRIGGEAETPPENSETAFVVNHYWGYTRCPDGTTLEYRVEHPPWRIYPVQEWRCRVEGETLYGEAFGEIFSQPPRSVFMAEGSPVKVYRGQKIYGE